MKEFVVFKSGKELYALNVMNVDSIIKYVQPNKIPNTRPYIKGVINLRGNIIPIMDFAEMINDFGENTKDNIVIVKKEDNLVGLIVDKVISVSKYDDSIIESTDKVLGENTDKKFLSGIIKTEDSLIGVIEINSLIE